jgi:predicted dehydrogenase
MNGELVGVFDHNPGKSLSFSTKFKCRTFTTAEELCNDPNIDIICICTPSGSHLEPALTAINAGRHCIIEKPIETTLERCDSIIEAGIKNKVSVSGIFPMRFSRVNIELRNAINEQRFGRLVLGDAYVKWFRKPEYFTEVKWRGELAKSGGGAVMNQAIHSVDLLQWFMGRVEAVTAFTGLLGHENIEVEDAAVASLRFASGALGVIEASTAVNPGFFRRIEILGTKGSVITEEENILIWKFDEERDTDQILREKHSGRHNSGGGVSDPKAISDIGHLRQLLDIIKAIDNNQSPPVDGIEARKAVEIVLAIYASARNKRTVYL